MEENNINNIENKDIINENSEEKVINSETERFQKDKDTSSFPQDLIINVDQEIKIEKEIDDKNKEEKEEEKVHEEEIEEEEEEINDFDDNIKIEKKTINISLIKVKDILKETQIEEKENLDLLKLELNFLAKKEYKWEVYRTPKEVKEFFKKLYKDLKNDNKAINLGTVQILDELHEYKEKQILESVPKIQKELDKILQNDYYNDNLILNEFLNIGGSSFSIYNNGEKPFEGWVEKKADPHCMRKVFAVTCKCLECWIFRQYNERWVVLKDDIITYSNLSQAQDGKHAYFFDEKIKAERSGKDIITITNLSRKLELRFKNYFERELWMQEIDKRITKFKRSLKNNKYKSFTNEKKNNYAHWFIDGKDYFEDLFQKLMEARRTIFITDWWLSPEVWLRRPIFEEDYIKVSKIKEDKLSRLMDILKFKAKKGVKIYILIYYECTLALTLNSKHTQETLEKLHKNIKVTRHPYNKLDLLWSHHEKLVIIDQQIGYVGGLDLCWGRYDFHEHPIYELPNSEKKYYFPCIDYSNARICDFVNVENFLKESVSRENNLRMPWHDVHTRIIGPVVGDIARHFVERWNHDNYDNRNETTIKVVNNNANSGENKLKSSNVKKTGFLGKILESLNKMKEDQSSRDSKNDDDMINGNKTITEEEDISNTFEIEENFDIKNKIKIAPVFNCQNNALKDLASINIKTEEIKENDEIIITNKNRRVLTEKEKKDVNIIRSNIKVKTLKNEINDFSKNKNSFWGKVLNKENVNLKSTKTIDYTYKNTKFELKKKEWMENLKEIDEDHFLVPKQLDSMIRSPDVINSQKSSEKGKSAYSRLITNIKAKSNIIFNEVFKANNEIEAIITEKYIKKNSPPSTVQVLRSAGEWSLGLNTVENSILQAYYKLIENSKHYIYIENQFFISKSFENKSYLVENKIALYIRNRILRACKNKEKFRVWIIIPLLPGFAGEPQTSSTLQIILKYTYAGICRNNGLSIIEKLQEELTKVGLNWEDYIGFYSLRNHGLFNGMPRTEIIYIHSKLMIVDDLYVICGSANINDRSMKGSRDSEFAVLIKEKRSEISIMNNKKFKAAKFATTFRKALMAEHLGIKPDDDILVDPMSDNLHQLIMKTAKENTFTYRQIFGCYPDDCYTKFNLIKDMNDIKNKAQEEYLKKNYEENKNKIKGHIVEFPLHFLEEEELGISFFSKENLVPERNFT